MHFMLIFNYIIGMFKYFIGYINVKNKETRIKNEVDKKVETIVNEENEIKMKTIEKENKMKENIENKISDLNTISDNNLDIVKDKEQMEMKKDIADDVDKLNQKIDKNQKFKNGEEIKLTF
jgi:hypothetical protein